MTKLIEVTMDYATSNLADELQKLTEREQAKDSLYAAVAPAEQPKELKLTGAASSFLNEREDFLRKTRQVSIGRY